MSADSAPDAKRSARREPRVLPERYVDLGLLARGGWGEVVRVHDRMLDRVVVMKILAAEHREADSHRARFMNEAQVTAALEHPGIVPVHDRGVLSDGRPWFTMKEVRGRTLQELLASSTTSALPLRRLVEIMLRVSETVGYAHRRGVIHRDLKPGNVMVGEFGEVMVLDWGVARPGPDLFGPETSPVSSQELVETDAQTGVGELLGTVAYMSPEQARGIGEPLTLASDVFALGLLLYEVIVGERARSRDRVQAWAMAAVGAVPEIAPERAPEELRVIVRTATAVSTEARYPHAMAVAERLRAWLDGSLARERAEALVSQAKASLTVLGALRRSRDHKRAEARTLLASIPLHAPVSSKRAAWLIEDEAEALHQRIAVAEASHVETLRAALELDPDSEAAHAQLAALHRQQVLDAELRHAPAEVAQAELLLRRHARSSHARFLRAVGRLVLGSAPAAAVRAARYVERERRLVPDAWRVLGRTPIDVELEAGSWLVELVTEEGLRTLLHAVVVRDETFALIRPGQDAPRVVPCIAVGPDEVHVPLGWARVGGDLLAMEPVPARTAWIDGFVIQRTSVTVAQYLRFLDTLSHEDVQRFAPRYQLGTAHDPDAPLAVEKVGGRLVVVRPGEGGQPVDPSWPVTSIDWHAARAFAEWHAASTGLPWRLPDELEWEKAARGADGRAHPWGHFCEPTWARIVGSTEGVPSRAPVGTHPEDVSPYGVLDVAGNARNWCAGAWMLDGPELGDAGLLRPVEASPHDPAMRVIRGGSWSSIPSIARCASRFAGRPGERYAAVGIRLVRSV